MNILLVTTEFPPSQRSGGIGSYNFDLANNLTNTGHSVTVLTSADKFFATRSEIKNNIYIRRIPFPDYFVGRSLIARIINKIINIVFYDFYRIRVAKLITRLDKKFKFDVVEFPEYGNEAKYWWPKKHIPTLVRFHGPSSLNRFQGKLELKTNREKREIKDLRHADGFSFVSDELRKVVSEHIKDNSCSSYVVHNCVDVPSYISESPLKDNNCYRIVGAGTIGTIKGWDLLYEACKKLRANNHDIRLDLYGRLADLGDYLSSKAATSEWLTLHGHTTRDILFAKYRSANLCCFPSRFEPMGLTALEAMGCGGLVLAGKLGGWKEAIEEAENGFLFDPNLGAEELSQKILKIKEMEEPSLNKIRIQARQYISNKNSLDLFIEKVTNIYKELAVK